MKKLLYYLPLYLVASTIIGIVVQFYTRFWDFGFLKIFVLSTFLILLLLLIKDHIIRTISSFILFFFVGVFTVFINNDSNYKSYYNYHLKKGSSVVFRITKVLKPTAYYRKYQVEITQVDTIKTKGKILVNIKKDSLLPLLGIDNQLYAKPVFKTLPPALNPYQFDYKSYLARQGIHQQIFLKKDHFLKLKNTPFSLIGFCERFRNTIGESLKKHAFKQDELAVINALLLGKRQEVSKELISDYSKAGAIHILAISGLHTGVILLILTFLFRPLDRVKKGKIIKTIIIILSLWMFAFIAGLSASVVRAVTMFTFLAVGQSFKQKKVIEFSLISSMLFLLLVKPLFLFDVGFQLSYIAVFSIIWIQPKLYKIYQPKLKILDKIWLIFSVSLAAQIGITPLSIYYFHQFSGLFLISNLVIIPSLMYILIGGFLVIILALFNILPAFLVTVYQFVIYLINSLIRWISHREAFLFQQIHISLLLLLAWYIFIIFGLRFFIHRKPKRFIYFLMAMFIVQSVFIVEKYQKYHQKELVVFHKNKHSILGKRIGKQLFVQSNLKSVNLTKTLKPYIIGEDIYKIHQITFDNFLQFANKNILLVDSLGIYKLQNLKKPVVILEYSPKINLKRLIKLLQPIQIIADGSNYKNLVALWEKTCKQEKTPFYYTGKNGAYILKE